MTVRGPNTHVDARRPYSWMHHHPHNRQLAEADLAATTTVALAIRRPLDLAAFTSLFGRLPGIELLAADDDLLRFVDACRQGRPQAALIDATYPDFLAFKTAEWLVNDGVVDKVAFLDERFAICRAQKALALDAACYMTRDSACDQITRWLRGKWAREYNEAGLNSGHNKLCKSRRLRVSRRLRINSMNDFDSTGVSKLTRRERTVMACIAKGTAIAEIAAGLRISLSTVDNHKSRIMKKLEVNRASQLVRLALDAGLID